MSSSQVYLKMDWVDHKASEYACKYYHYSHRIPKSKQNFIGAWEDKKFIGVVIFGYGACNNLLKPYGLTQWEGCELTRVALKGYKTPVTRIISIALKMLKRKNPGLRLIVSFADPNHGHHGGIYQGGNWIYTGKSASSVQYRDRTGRMWHPRNVGPDTNKPSICITPSSCVRIVSPGKHRYLMALDKEMKEKIIKLSQPYLKCVDSVSGSISPVQGEDGGSKPTSTHHTFGGID